LRSMGWQAVTKRHRANQLNYFDFLFESCLVFEFTVLIGP
jgi:hypothetical protein